MVYYVLSPALGEHKIDENAFSMSRRSRDILFENISVQLGTESESEADTNYANKQMVQNLRHATVGGKQLSKQIGPIGAGRKSKVKEGEEEERRTTTFSRTRYTVYEAAKNKILIERILCFH